MNTNPIYRRVRVVVLVLALSSCATSYQKSGFTGGYSEKKISDSAYTVAFSGNGFASRDRVYFFWIYRCAELTLEKGYSLYVIRSNHPQARNGLPDATLLPALYTGNSGGEFVKTHGGGGVIIVPGVGSGANKWTYSATVLMYKKPLPQEVLWGVDAEQTVALLRPYVTSNGSIPPPSRDDLFRKAFLAHARISIGESATVALDDVAPAATNADGSPRSDPHIRTADSIADTISATRLIALHGMYRAYVGQLRSLDPSGDIVLQFSVSPNGQVRDCRATSSSFKDRAFTDAVIALVGQTEFTPLDVGTTRVKNFRISFAELPEGVT